MTTRACVALATLIAAAPAPASAQAPGLRIDPRFGVDAVRGRVDLAPAARVRTITFSWDRAVRFHGSRLPTCSTAALRDEDAGCAFASNVGLGAVTFRATDGRRVDGKVLAFNQAGGGLGLVVSLPGRRDVVAAGRLRTRGAARTLEVRLPGELQAMPLVRFTLRLRRLHRGREFVTVAACPDRGFSGAVEVVPVEGPPLAAESVVPCGPGQ